MPRRSAASLQFATVKRSSERLRPPAGLTESERQIFLSIVAAEKPEHFRASDLALLINHVQAIVAAGDANAHLSAEGRVVDGKPSPWLAVLTQAQKAIGMFSLRLRLSPQGRSPTVSGRPGKPSPSLSYYDLMDLRENAGDDGAA
jgi:hypothetical protein